MPNTATITAVTGAAQTVTAAVFTGFLSLTFDEAAQIIRLVDSNSVTHEFSLYGVTTVTYTISGHLATVTIS